MCFWHCPEYESKTLRPLYLMTFVILTDNREFLRKNAVFFLKLVITRSLFLSTFVKFNKRCKWSVNASDISFTWFAQTKTNIKDTFISLWLQTSGTITREVTQQRDCENNFTSVHALFHMMMMMMMMIMILKYSHQIADLQKYPKPTRR